MEYDIVMGDSVDDLALHVNGKIKSGWLPQGGVSSWYDYVNGGVYYIQAVVRKTQESKES